MNKVSMTKYFKFTRIAWLAVSLVAAQGLALAPQSFASCGKNCGGGGTRTTSTREEIQAELEAIQKGQSFVFNTVLWELAKNQAFNADQVSDPTLKRGLQRFKAADPQRRDSVLFTISWETVSKLNLQEKCIEEGKEVDTSTQFRKGAPICISLSKFSQVSPTDLPLQLAAVVMHEYVHHFQPVPQTKRQKADLEAEAKAVQDYTLALLNQAMHSSLLKMSDALQRGQADSYNYGKSMQVQSLFPGGEATISRDRRGGGLPGVFEVLCVNKIQDVFEALGKYSVILAPGDAFSGLEYGSSPRADLKTIFICQNLPAVDCKTESIPFAKDPAKVSSLLWVGDYLAEEVQGEHSKFYIRDFYQRYQRLGICKRPQAAPGSDSQRTPGEQEKAQ